MDYLLWPLKTLMLNGSKFSPITELMVKLKEKLLHLNIKDILAIT